MKGDAKARCQAGTGRSGKGEVPDRLERRLDGGQELCGNRLRCPAGDLGPNVGKVGLGRPREAEG